jgi:hypothetical protein
MFRKGKKTGTSPNREEKLYSVQIKQKYKEFRWYVRNNYSKNITNKNIFGVIFPYIKSLKQIFCHSFIPHSREMVHMHRHICYSYRVGT